MRRVGDPVELLGAGSVGTGSVGTGSVGTGSVGTGSVGDASDGGRPPLAFRWQGRRYVVGSVLAHWVETGAWWRTTGEPAPELPDPERQMWRVEVCRGNSTGVFDLCQDTTGWSLRGVHD